MREVYNSKNLSLIYDSNNNSMEIKTNYHIIEYQLQNSIDADMQQLSKSIIELPIITKVSQTVHEIEFDINVENFSYIDIDSAYTNFYQEEEIKHNIETVLLEFSFGQIPTDEINKAIENARRFLA